MTVAIYVRVSTREQALEGYSVPAQKSRLKAYCEAQGWKNYKFYVDAGISAKDMDRDELQRMLKDVKEKKIKMILVFRLDRFTRSVRDLYEMLDMLDSHGCAFKSATEIYDTSSAMGRMFIGIVALLAQWERENIGERVVVALEERASDLKAIGTPPYGFEIKNEFYAMTSDEDEQYQVRWLIENVLNGKPLNAMARHLNDRHIPTPRGKGVWYTSTIKRLLSNPALCGTYVYKDLIAENAFEGYIDKETFNTIQEKLDDRATEYVRGVTTDAVFHGVLKCPECGHTLNPATYYSKVSKEKLGYTYKCRDCREKRYYYKSYNEQKLMEPFLNYLKHYADVIEPELPKEELNNDADKLKKQVESIENQRLKYQRAWANELMTDNEFKKLMHESAATLTDIENELKNLPAEKRSIDPEQLKEIMWTLKETFTYMTSMEQRNFISRFIKSIHFRVDSEIVPNRKRPRDSFHVTDVELY